MSTPHTSTRPAGTYAAYKVDGCRCYPCAAAVSAYRLQRERAVAAGTWQPFVDAQPVRDHLALLASQGIGWRRTAHLAGLSNGTVGKLLYGRPSIGRAPSSKVRAETAAAILAVRPASRAIADHAVVDATGYRRRMQALVARGFTQRYLAGRLGIAPRNFDIRATRVLARTHRAATALYDELWDRDPLTCGVTELGVSRALAFAAAHGWPPPAAWDDDTIDDPAALPDLGEKTRRQDALVEDAAWIAKTTGADRTAIAQRLGVSRNYLEKTLERAAAAA